ncbi:MAG: spore germination protein [Limnochordia bacterium]|jgi:spore germination protein
MIKRLILRLFSRKCEPIVRNSRIGVRISPVLAKNLHTIKTLFEDADDVTVREFKVGGKGTSAAVVYISGMLDNEVISAQLLKTLMLDARQIKQWDEPDLLDRIKGMITIGDLKEIESFDDAVYYLLAGKAVLFVDTVFKALAIGAQGWEQRGVEQPVAEAVIRGPRDSFCECVTTNITLVRQRLKDPSLKIKMYLLGRRSRTAVALVYIADIIDPGILEEAQNRLDKVDIDSLTDSGYLEQLISDSWWSPFDTVQATERPDEVVGGLLEGRFALICDNSPFVILAPTTINTLMHSPEDYYISWSASTIIRMVRFVGSFLALTLPAVYIALVSYNPEMIPTTLALTIAAARDGIPFPAVTEAFVMELMLELLREAGIRLPGPIGQTIGIVGGIIIGDAAVRAGLVSPVMVIIVASTAIASFLIPTYSLTITVRNLRFFLMTMAAVLGLFGVSMGMLVILVHLATLKSFGVSMLSPWSPLRIRAFQDTVIRFPWLAMKARPRYLHPQDPDRLSDRRTDQFGDHP